MTGNSRIPKANSRIAKDKSRRPKPCVILRYIFTTPIKPIFDIFSPLIIWYQKHKVKTEKTKNKIKKR